MALLRTAFTTAPLQLIEQPSGRSIEGVHTADVLMEVDTEAGTGWAEFYVESIDEMNSYNLIFEEVEGRLELVDYSGAHSLAGPIITQLRTWGIVVPGDF